jgi:hypothetical protein
MARKKKAFTPANRYLRYQITVPPGGTERSFYLDIARDLSAINRRLYRQGKVYQIANISVTSRDTSNGLVSFSTAPDTWVTRAAWNRGFKMYNEMNKQVLGLPGSNARKGRYHDFKVYLSNDHRVADPLLQLPRPRDNGNNMAGSGEWIYSTYQSPDGTTSNDEFNVHLLGDHVGAAGSRDSISLVYSYGESRPSVQVQEPLMDEDGSDDPLLNLFDTGTHVDEIASDLENDNDSAPYKVSLSSNPDNVGEFYPGSQGNLPKPMVCRLAAIGQPGGSSAPTIMLPGFTAIAGLIEIEAQSSEDSDDVFDVLIEIAPGGYKGVAAFDI